MTRFFTLLDALNAWLNFSLLTGQAGLAGVTGGRTLVFLVCTVCALGVIIQIRRASPYLRALARGEQTVPIPATQLMQLVGVFLLLIVVLAVTFGVQASTTYYAVQAKTIGQRDVVVSLTRATVIFHAAMICLGLVVARLSVVIADVVTGTHRPRRDWRLTTPQEVQHVDHA